MTTYDSRIVTGLRAFASAAALFAVSCAASDEWKRPTPEPDAQLFLDQVYPVLLRDCAFPACHGGRERFLQVFGPGRVRLDAKTRIDDAIELAEVRHSYDRARSLLGTDENLEQSLLLSKPLALEAGGQGHEGADDFGQNVFASRADPRYLAILSWSVSTGSAPDAHQVRRARAALERTADAMREASP